MLYLLSCNVGGYDVMRSCVVNAADEQSARFIAAGNAGDEGANLWLNVAECKFVGVAANQLESGLICRDFIAG